jgi:hypothetical protein
MATINEISGVYVAFSWKSPSSEHIYALTSTPHLWLYLVFEIEDAMTLIYNDNTMRKTERYLPLYKNKVFFVRLQETPMKWELLYCYIVILLLRNWYTWFSLILNISITDCGMTLFFILCIKIHLFLFSRSLKGCQFSSFKISLDLVSYVLPVITLSFSQSFWNFVGVRGISSGRLYKIIGQVIN